MRKFKMLTAMGILATTMALTGCKTFGDNSQSNANQNQNGQQTAVSQVAYQLVTASPLLSNQGATKRAILPEHQDILDQVDNIEVFFYNTMDSIQAVQEASDRPEYEFKETVTYLVELDQTATLTYYYNSFEHIERDDGEISVETYMTGVLVTDTGEYQFKSQNETEEDWGESETSMETLIFTSNDRKSYVATERESEREGIENEESYLYRKVENLRVVESYELQLENEGNQNEKEAVFIQNGKTCYFKAYGRNGKEYIAIAIRENGKKEYVTYLKTTDANGVVDYVQI